MSYSFNANEMKEREIFSHLAVFPPFAVRVDGRSFHRALSGFAKPYDERFAHAMADSIESFFRDSGFYPLFAFTFSDEISFIFREIPYNNRVEKIDSIISGFISSALTIQLKFETPISFDARVILLGNEDIYKYLLWRQAETWRNHVSSYGFHTLLKAGLSENEAGLQLNKMKASSIHELVFRYGINLAQTPAWQRCGILVYREKYEKTGFDPIRKMSVVTERTGIKQDWSPPIFKSEEGEKLIKKLLS